MYVLDTNTLIYFFRGEGRVAERMLSTAPSAIAIPSIVVFELETGIAKSRDRTKRRAQLDTLLKSVRVLPFDLAEAKAAAEIRARLERTGKGIGPLDTLIAGTAVANAGTLITRNQREFKRVTGLSTESWY